MNIRGFLRRYYLGVLVSALGLDFLALELPMNYGAVVVLIVIALMVMSLYGFHGSLFLRAKHEQ